MSLTTLAYLSSHLLSLLGNSIAAVALPLIVLQTTGSPLGMSALATATAIPAVAVGLLSGVIIDRINRRTASVVSDVISALSIAALPVVDLLWGLDLVWFILLGILGSFGDVPGMTAREVLAPMVARHTGMDLHRLIGLRQTVTSASLVIGPAVAGTLIATLGTTPVLWVTAATSALAALVTRLLPRELGEVATGEIEAGTGSRRPLRRELLEGLVLVRRNRYLLGTFGLVIGVAVAVGGLQGMVMPLYFALIGRPGLLGLVLTALAVGMLLGASVYSILGARLPGRVWLGGGLALTTAGLLTMASVLQPAIVFAGAVLLGAGNAVVGALSGVLQIRHTTGAVRGRVLSVQTALLTVAAPAGIALSGVVAEASSARWAGVGLAGAWILVLMVVLASRALRDLDREELPDAQQ